ncbi:hypothetical protein Gogos_010033 [Gossypium gossypioides]|uniref:Uncharacterized protein n=1 Tax=Gossypium gossypioides TaxID=34282 RepID=A0A7J9BJW2_GOSGO|nr:hypothetical protein [Gossypium gossypioides]
MDLEKRPRTGASSSHQSSGPRLSFNECFRTNALCERFDRNFASKRVWESRKVDIVMLEGINFFYLSILQNWGWMDFLNISSPTYYNLFRMFYSNAKLEHDESGDIVIAITSFLMNTSIRLTLEELRDYLHLPSRDIQAPEHVPSHEHAPHSASFSQATQPSSEINGAILDVIHSLINNVRGLRDEVRSHKDEVNSRLDIRDANGISHCSFSIDSSILSS